jgi:AmiR/NasT family two-component response regulator
VLGYEGCMGDRQTDDATIGEASAITMDRYELTEPGAMSLLGRLARYYNVTLPVMAAAIIAAAIARRKREDVA